MEGNSPEIYNCQQQLTFMESTYYEQEFCYVLCLYNLI